MSFFGFFGEQMYLVTFVDGSTVTVCEALALEYAREWRLANAGSIPRTVKSIDRLVEVNNDGGAA